LPDLIAMTKAIAPPTTEKVETILLHALEQFPPTSRRTRQLLFLLFRRRCIGWRHRLFWRNARDTAEIALPIDHHALIRGDIIVEAELWLQG
jgi:hypothetical protein